MATSSSSSAASGIWRRLWDDAGAVVRGFTQGRFVARELLVTRLAEHHRQNYLGWFSLLLPVIATAAWATLVRHAKVINVPEVTDDMPYAAFVLLSMILWQTFVEAISAPLEALNEQLPSLAHANFPVEAVTLSRLGLVLVNLAIKLVLFAAAVVYFGLHIKATVLLAPVAALMLILFGLGLGLILAPFNVFYRDVSAALQPLTTFWLFVTPVLFPAPSEGWVAWLFRVNPATPLLATTRELTAVGAVSQPLGFAIMCCVAVGLFILGSIAVRRTVPLLVEMANV